MGYDPSEGETCTIGGGAAGVIVPGKLEVIGTIEANTVVAAVELSTEQIAPITANNQIQVAGTGGLKVPGNLELGDPRVYGLRSKRR
mmetsp:Transcript_38806/g.93363  ORF Transcript_38806/g.93363 Transcript_38806/m.93363 type:complete len:87 (-) Transcript_38806:128-388(-)